MRKSLVCSYSRAITAWLVRKFPGAVALDSSGARYEEIIGVFQLLLPAVEFQATTQGQFGLGGRIRDLSGLKDRSQQLGWLMDLFAKAELPEPVKDELYGRLKVFVKWEPDPGSISQHLHLQVPSQWVPEQPGKPIRTGKEVRLKIGPPLELTRTERTFLLDAMKLSLALHCRETDPVTYADPASLVLFGMGEGLHIAVVGMEKEKRLSLESYMGYMIFRNGVPVAYGGGWIWDQRCRIGISIYPDFRKSGSARMFTQVLRLYYQYFNARHFIIRANQFGKGNHDGLKSGAFWFYYKLGFRPGNARLRKLAAAEWRKIRADRRYRSSLETLRLFLTAPLEWKPAGTPSSPVDAEAISRRISDVINREYDGSRKKALRDAKTRFTTRIKPVSVAGKLKYPAFANWGLLVNLLPGFEGWKTAEKRRLVQLIESKRAGREREHITGMQNFSVFWKSLNKLEFSR